MCADQAHSRERQGVAAGWRRIQEKVSGLARPGGGEKKRVSEGAQLTEEES